MNPNGAGQTSGNCIFWEKLGNASGLGSQRLGLVWARHSKPPPQVPTSTAKRKQYEQSCFRFRVTPVDKDRLENH